MSKKGANGAAVDLAPEEEVVLYVNDSDASSQASRILRDAGVELAITDGPVEQLQTKPLAIYRGSMYQGLEEIEALIALLVYRAAKANAYRVTG